MKRSRARAAAIFAAVLVLLLVASAAIYARIRSSGDEESAAAESGSAPAASGSADVAIPVHGDPAVRGDLVLSVSAAGQAEAWKQTVLTAQVAGRIVTLPVRESSAVGAGQTVVALDPAEYALAVQEAEAKVRDARARFQELTLFDERIEDAETRRERERIARSKSGLELAEVQLKRARLDAARTRLHAPFAGRVASVKVVPGAFVRQGDELMTLVDLDPIKVEVQVLESEVGYLEPGGGASVAFAAFPERTFRGRVETINPMVESGTRTARVTVLVPARDVRPRGVGSPQLRGSGAGAARRHPRARPAHHALRLRGRRPRRPRQVALRHHGDAERLAGGDRPRRRNRDGGAGGDRAHRRPGHAGPRRQGPAG
jgi:multidrug efflux pump subunit AcrA (membrane-fusion protein)